MHPYILMLGVHLAHLTEQLKFGSGFNIAPMWHPPRLGQLEWFAEEIVPAFRGHVATPAADKDRCQGY